MKKETIKAERTQYSEKCPICGEPIKAFSESNLKYNMGEHIKKHERNIRIDKALFSPALRITIIDDRELIMALKRYDEKDTRINITEISGIQSDNRDFIRSTRDTFIMLRTLADVKVVQKLLGDRQ